MGRPLRRVGLILLALLAVAAVVGLWLWNDRPDPAGLGIPVAAAASGDTPGVTVTWLGVTTLLFDDGETRLLTDGFFSRPGLWEVLGDRPVAPDTEGIERGLAAAGITRLAAVIPVHSHYDHAMDSAEVARRTGALVLGSPSTANLARGAGLAEERIVSLPDGASRRFGRFLVTLVRSRHAPLGEDGDPPFPGTIDAPLTPPAAVSAWKEGRSYSIVIAHPSGTALVQGSAGYVEGSLDGVRADAVFLGVGGLESLGRSYAATYWKEIVGRSGARRVFPVHFDDFTRPYGDLRPFPRFLEDLEASFGWLGEFAARSTPPVRVELLPFREPVALF